MSPIARVRHLGLLAAALLAVEGQAAAQQDFASCDPDMPICTGIYHVLYEKLPARDLVRDLMSRPLKSEQQ